MRIFIAHLVSLQQFINSNMKVSFGVLSVDLLQFFFLNILINLNNSVGE